MFKKLFSVALVGILALSLQGCGKEKNLKSDNNNVTNKKAEITVYLPEGQQIDNKYYKDQDVAVNYLPDNKNRFTEKEVNQIVNNIDKHVKVVAITTDKSGLNDVFKKVKAKLPGVITVAGDIGEMHDGNLWKIKKNPNLDVAFQVDNQNRAIEAAKTAKLMGAKKFEYLYLNDNDGNPSEGYDRVAAEDFCKENNIEFKSAEVANDNYKKIIDDFAGNDFAETAVYSASPKLSKDVLKYALEKKFMVPDINSSKDGELLAEVLGLKDEYKELPREEFDKAVSSKLKKENMQGKIAGISEGLYSLPAELTIEIAKYMYEKNYMIEECYTDSSLVDRGNRNLQITILPQDMGISSGYVRNLVISPRIY